MSEEEQHDGLSRMESVLGQKASALRHCDGMRHMIASKRGSPGAASCSRPAAPSEW